MLCDGGERYVGFGETSSSFAFVLGDIPASPCLEGWSINDVSFAWVAYLPKFRNVTIYLDLKKCTVQKIGKDAKQTSQQLLITSDDAVSANAQTNNNPSYGKY